MQTITLQELPYIAHIPSDGRGVVAFPVTHPDGRTEVYLHHQDVLRVMRPVAHIEGAFLAESEIDKDRDIYLPLSDCVLRYFSFSTIVTICKTIEDDLRNSLAVLHKYFVLLKHASRDSSLRTALIVATEIEYAFSNHRALYDQLNKIIAEWWKALRFFRPDKEPSKLPELPASFRRVGEQSEEALSNKYMFPQALVQFYKSRLNVFMSLREIRDAMLHHGKTIDMIFHFEDGFALALDHGLVSRIRDLGIWSEASLKPNALGSLLSLFAFLAHDGFEAARALSLSLSAAIRLPPPLLKDSYRTFYRSQLGPHFHELAGYKEKPWRSADEILKRFGHEDGAALLSGQKA